MTRRGEIPGQAGNDGRSAGNYKVTPNNIHMESSFEISKKDFENALKTLREQYPDSLVWNRSIKSLKHEWAAHNAFHSLGIFRKQTAHADLNWPQPWLIRLGYAIIGRVVWPFIK